jgi:uncharacterized protein YtpQ (UPF0354 family)
VVELEQNQDYAIMNLHNLISKFRDVERNKWPEIINSHFQGMFESMEEQKKLDPSDFNTLTNYLSIRVYQESFVNQNGGIESFVLKKDLDGTYSLLMLDLPSMFTPVQKEMFDLWNKSVNEVFEIAQKNVNKQQFVKQSEKIEVNGKEIIFNFLESEDYAASIALDLKTNVPEFIGELGTIVAIPNKGIINAFKISKESPLDFILFIQKARPIVQQFYSQHPQPISTEFYWLYDNKFTKITIVETDKELKVISPIALTELLNK